MDYLSLSSSLSLFSLWGLIFYFMDYLSLSSSLSLVSLWGLIFYFIMRSKLNFSNAPFTLKRYVPNLGILLSAGVKENPPPENPPPRVGYFQLGGHIPRRSPPPPGWRIS